MTKRIVTVEMDDTLSTVKGIFEHIQFHHLLVIDDSILMGVISDRDLFKALSPWLGSFSEKKKDTVTFDIRTHQIMSRDLITFQGNASVYDAMMF